MKKGLILGLACLVVLSGCGKKDEAKANNTKKDNSKSSEKVGKNTVVCTGKVDEEGLTAEMKVTASLKAGKVDNASVSLVFSDKETAEQYCSLFELANSFAESEDDKVDFTCKGKTLTFKNYADFADPDDEDDIIGLTKADFIKLMEESDGVTCK